MRCILKAGTCGLLLFSPWIATAQDAPVSSITWVCRVPPRELNVIHCREGGAPDSAALAPTREDPLPRHFTADLFANPQRRNVAWLVRAQPEAYGNRVWTIPAISPIVDVPRARELVHSTMCGREPACTVELSLPP